MPPGSGVHTCPACPNLSQKKFERSCAATSLRRIPARTSKISSVKQMFLTQHWLAHTVGQHIQATPPCDIIHGSDRPVCIRRSPLTGNLGPVCFGTYSHVDGNSSTYIFNSMCKCTRSERKRSFTRRTPRHVREQSSCFCLYAALSSRRSL
jgi:hypothetical protein